MGKKIAVFLLLTGIFSCRGKQEHCGPDFYVVIHPAFIGWAEPYSPDSTGYMRYKSSKGAEESLEITRDRTFSYWYLQDYTDCYNGHGEWRNYDMKSTLYNKYFEVGILQYTLFKTQLYLVNRTVGVKSVTINFEENKSPEIVSSPCDTCVKFERNVTVNGTNYPEIIRFIYLDPNTNLNPEAVWEMVYAKGFGLIQYTSIDSTVWNAVY